MCIRDRFKVLPPELIGPLVQGFALRPFMTGKNVRCTVFDVALHRVLGTFSWVNPVSVMQEPESGRGLFENPDLRW